MLLILVHKVVSPEVWRTMAKLVKGTYFNITKLLLPAASQKGQRISSQTNVQIHMDTHG